MPENIPPSNDQAADEIDLGQLLRLLKKGFHDLGNLFLRVFLFFKKYALILIGLLLLGVAISYGLNQVISKKLKTEVIVRPNFDSKDYLYDVVAQLNSNISTGDKEFFAEAGIEVEDLRGFQINIEAIESEEIENQEKRTNDMKYLETLNGFQDQSLVNDILRTELAEKSVLVHKITFFYIDKEKGPAVIGKLMEYINTNEYLNKLKDVAIKNAKARIDNNTKLIDQIDVLVANYSKSLSTESTRSTNATFSFEKENTLDVPSLLSLKNKLLIEIEEKDLEITQHQKVISIINTGSTQEVRKPFFSDRKFKIPLVLVLGFLGFVFIRYLNAKAREIS